MRKRKLASGNYFIPARLLVSACSQRIRSAIGIGFTKKLKLGILAHSDPDRVL